MRRNKRRTGGRRSAHDKIKYMRMAAIALLAVIVLVVIILFMDKKPWGHKAAASGTAVSSESGTQVQESQSAQTQESQSKGESVAPDNSQYTTDYSDYELQKDAVPQVNQLISDYFQAKVDQNVDKLYQIFGKAPDDSMQSRKEELKDEAVYIEDYENIVCYTKPGLTADSYVVYVTYEVKFRRVDTLAPGLMWCYVLKDDSGNYIIRENVVGAEADYVAKQNQSEDVRLLSSQVNERLRQAIESDSLLAGIYKDLRNGAVVPSSGEDSQDSAVSLDDSSSAALDGGGAAQPAGSAAQTPGSDEQTPGSDAQTPGSDTQAPGSDTQAPGSDAQAPGSAAQTQGSGAKPSETPAKAQASGTKGTAAPTSGGSAVKID